MYVCMYAQCIIIYIFGVVVVSWLFGWLVYILALVWMTVCEVGE